MNEIPERPLSDEARARRRAELMNAIETKQGVRRWLVPAVAAAAVVGVVSVGAAVAISGGDESGAPGEPAGTGGPNQPATQSPHEPGPDKQQTPPKDPDASFPEPNGESCAELDPRIKGAHEVESIDVGETTVRVYANAQQYVTCDEWPRRNGGSATLFAARGVDAPLTKDRFRISMNFGPGPGDSEYVAGGLVPDGASEITYRFSDGSSVDAVIENGVWAMAYFPDQDLPADATTDVSVTTDSGTEEFTLRMGIADFCAQVNHGC